MKKETTRLHFSEEDLENAAVSRAAGKAERAADRADAAKARLPTKGKLRDEKEKTAFYGEQLRFGKKDFSGAGEEIVSPGRPTGRSALHAAAGMLSARAHREIAEHENDNAGVQAAHQSEAFMEGTGRAIDHASYSRKLKNYRKAVRLEKKADKANVEALFQKSMADNPEAASNPLSRWKQRQEIKKQYAATKSAGSTAAGAKSAGGTAKGTKKAAKGAGTLLERLKEFAVQHSHALWLVLIFAFLLMMISGMFSSCSAMLEGGSVSILGTSFTAEDEDIIGANEDYRALEEELRRQLDRIETDHPGYDEYRYQLDEINHNPYELTAYLTVTFEDYTRAEVQSALRELFQRQYTLTLREEVEVRTRTETHTHTSTDPETGETTEEEYEVEVEYNYYILHVTLTNHSLGSAIEAGGLSADQQERYEILLQTKGNRPYLFGDDIYANSSGEYLDYDIPGEALTDEKFANMIREAEKYLGMSYVWGGSTPSTGFDCSGFVCWVINNSGNGWNVGRTTANGLMSSCDIIRASEAQPGDLIFFQGTYDTAGASHVGIYVGNGMMIHCGNPISYASIETNYWQSHFYCYGRIR